MKRFIQVRVGMCFEFKAPMFVKVKAHTRTIRGKVVTVRSHLRRVWGR